MTIQTRSWESTLLHWATEPLQSGSTHLNIVSPSTLLTHAYQHCTGVTRHHSRTFHLASGLLPAQKRQAVRALYAVCRISDDIVDRAEAHDSDPQATLEDWYLHLTHKKPTMHHPVVIAWADTKTRFNVPDAYVRQLIDGVSLDLQDTRYETFSDLAEYAYRVASTVGLMSMCIIGYADEAAIPYAIKLGVALQITNILRDVGEDLRNGRVYLPQQELAEYGLSDASLERGVITDNWRAFMHFQIKRTRELYAEALPGIAYLHADGRFAIAAAAELYQAILTDIEKHDYDVFSRRASISKQAKLMRLPGIWWRSSQGLYA